MFVHICLNRKARNNYHVLQTVEAGIMLQGHEIKSIRKRSVDIDSSYAKIEDGQVWWVNGHIEPFHSDKEAEPRRQRQLLLQAAEIRKLATETAKSGNTLVPLSLYIKNGKAKLELALVTGKQMHDKREDLKEKQAKKEIRDYV